MGIRYLAMSAPLARSGGAGAIQGTARLLGQSVGAALVALVFGLAGGHGAKATIVLAAGFAAVGTLTTLSRMFDFVRARFPVSRQPSLLIAPEPDWRRSSRGEQDRPLMRPSRRGVGIRRLPTRAGNRRLGQTDAATVET
jgi:hypothetical protein